MRHDPQAHIYPFTLTPMAPTYPAPPPTTALPLSNPRAGTLPPLCTKQQHCQPWLQDSELISHTSTHLHARAPPCCLPGLCAVNYAISASSPGAWTRCVHTSATPPLLATGTQLLLGAAAPNQAWENDVAAWTVRRVPSSRPPGRRMQWSGWQGDDSARRP